jgi:uncharacterized repeat protein (TIGR02543 family)
MERFFTRMARLGRAATFFAAVAALVFALAACPNPAGDEEPEPAQYTITFDSQEGSAVTAIKADEGTALTKPADPTREGYAFQGWFNAATGGAKYEWPHTLNADLTMYAQWQEDTQQPVQHTITFDSQGGSAVAAITAVQGTAVPQPTDPTRNNYTFQGWHSAATEGTAYTWPHTLNADVTMYARWQAIVQHTITFESHGGSAVAAIKADAGTAVEKPTDPTREDYAFQGWFSAETGGTLYPWPHTLTVDLTMHAHWQDDTEPEPEKRTIAFDSHGGSAVSAITANEGTEVNKPTDPTRNAYDFAGWFDAETGGAAYDWPHTLNADLTMHAQWTAASYTISYNLNGGTGADNSSYTIESPEITLPVPTKTGYTFDGWFAAGSFAGEAITTIAAGSSGNKTFYAKWTIVSYTISYELNDGTNPGNPLASYTVESPDITLPVPTKTGYAFGGWFDTGSFAGTAITKIDKGSTGSKIFYAKWTAITYTVEYNTNNGTGTTAASSHTYDVAKALTTNGFARTGYAFAGWNAQANGNGTSYADGASVTNLTTAQGATVTLYAQWTAITYTVAYNTNGGTGGATESSDHTYDVEKALAANGFTKTGHTFIRWDTKPDGAGDSYTNGQSVKNLATTQGATVTLYAQWSVSYAIAYTLNDATGNGGNPDSYTAESLPLTLRPPVKTGYTGKWYDNENLTGEAVTVIAAGTTGNKAYYAGTSASDWTLVTYTIAYILNGGTNHAENPANYNFESALITLNPPTRTGYTFGGWFENSGFAGAAATQIPANSDGNKTFYAKWLEGTVNSIAYYWVDEHGELATASSSTTLAKPNTLTFTALSAGYSDWAWYLNGQPVAGANTDTYIFDSADKDFTNYAVGIRVKKGDKYYYTEITVTVTNQ